MAGGLLGQLIQASQHRQGRMSEAIEGFQTQVRQEKLKKHLRNYIQEYGMDISRESVEGFLDKNPDANITDLGKMFEAIKMQRGAQTEGDYTLGPGMQRRGFGDEIKAEVPFKPAPIKLWNKKDKYPLEITSPEEAFKYLSDSETWRLGGAGGGYKPEDEAAAIRLKEAGRTTISIGEAAAKAAEVKSATTKAGYQEYLRSSPKVKDDAMKTAKEQLGSEWEDLPETSMDPKSQSKEGETFKIMNNWYQTIGAKFASKGGVMGWYLPDKDGKPGKLVKDW